MKRFFLIIVCCIIWTLTDAQVLHTGTNNLDELFQNDITTMSEFRARFNAAIEISSNLSENERLKRILSLFNRNSEAILEKQDLVLSFSNQILKSGVPLEYGDSSWYADVLCAVKYKGAQFDIHLILKTEEVEKSIYRWAFIGANGLRETNIIHDAAFGFIEPIDDELNFIDLDNRLQKDYTNAFGYKSFEASVNQLSILLYLIQEKELTIESMDKIRYHFLSIPGYVFIVEQSGTPMNSGWLISELSTITNEGKKLYEKVLFGNY